MHSQFAVNDLVLELS